MTKRTETKRPPWWPTAEHKLHADAGCAHPDECKVTQTRDEVARFMRRPCFDGYTSLRWAVTGEDVEQGGAGVLAWCYDRDDANEALRLMRRMNGRFRGLTVEDLTANDAGVSR